MDYYWFFVFTFAVGFIGGILITLILRMVAGYFRFRFKGGKH